MIAWPLRALGILPALFLGAYVLSAYRHDKLGDSLWMCHVANALLALGILGNWPIVIGIAALWIVYGIPLWAFDMWQTGDVRWVSVVSHLGGLAVALWALSQVRMSANPWIYALLLYLVVQQISRWVTPAALNVNLAHRIYEGSPPWFSSYAVYWFSITMAAALTLWAIGLLLMHLFPPLRDA